jgi:hypothetical protein
LTTVTAWVEMWHSLAGTLRLACGDRRGLSYFDLSHEGFWRSFRAAILAYPLFLILLTMRTSGREWAAAGGFKIVTVETIGYVIAWVAFPLAMLKLTELFRCERRFFAFMVAYNWSQIPQSVLFVLVGLEAESGLLGAGMNQVIGLAAASAVLLYEWFIARAALEVSGFLAALVVLLDLLLSLIVVTAAAALY